QQRGNRRQVVLATKVRGRMWDGPNGEGLSRAHIIQACEDSLRRLQTDWIDLYQTHWYDAETPIEETLRALDDLVRAGKVRYIGCSNLPAWRLTTALWQSDKLGLARYDALQPHYSLVHRAEFEREMADLCREQQLGVIPYSPLAGGFLTGKYRKDQPLPESARANSVRRYFTERNWVLLEAMEGLARTHGKTVSQIALAWQLAQPVITSPIIGANSVEQLNESLGAVGLGLADDEIKRLNDLSSWAD
ncbi:MAG: aldo/keto reductase, partial [Anaerolineae bacterium]